MAIKESKVCDFKVNGHAHEAPASVVFTGRIGTVELAGDFCEPHAKDFEAELIRLGLRIEGVRVDSKRRNHYIAHSGVPFTTQEAREWLIAQGYWRSKHGRIPQDLLDMYAQEH
jgi:hypothetical protein